MNLAHVGIQIYMKPGLCAQAAAPKGPKGAPKNTRTDNEYIHKLMIKPNAKAASILIKPIKGGSL